MYSKNNLRRGRHAARIAALVASTHIALVAGAPPEHAPGLANFPDITLPDKAQGQAAIDALGSRFPDVAAAHDMHPSEFAQMLRNDRSAWLDNKARLYFVEDLIENAEGDATDTLASAQYPLSETFTLHSKPGSNRVIYLDFDGHVTTGTAWNNSYNVTTIDSPPYDTNSNPEFSNTELANIQAMWRQVAEDFAPFDVNVTTEDPGDAAIIRSGSTDDFYGTRVVITRDNFANCGCGGFAYVGVYAYTGSFYKPAFVFNSGVVSAGEAITHEAGHNLGLSHDGIEGGAAYYRGQGSGDTGWAPIMGVGYYQKLVQWSKGEYANPSNTQDDLLVIQNNGVPLLADDHGDNSGAASVLTTTPAGGVSELSGVGNIHSDSDVDVFNFVAGAGSYSIGIDPVPVSPNLDVALTLRDSSGVIVGSDNPADSLPASLNGNLTGGEYFLYVEGTGKGNPADTGYSAYGSLGRYEISGTVADGGSLAAPVAVAAADYASGTAPLPVSLDGSASTDADGDVENWAWDFGDGNTGSGEMASHTYDLAGTFTVNLTVTDNDGLTASDSVQVDVTNTPPTAVADADVVEGEAPLTVNFTGSNSTDGDGSISSAGWTFGDGDATGALDPTHTYTAPGSYTATLTVTDNLGDSDSQSVSIEVTAPPFVDSYVSSEEPSAGTLGGSVSTLQVNDGQFRTVRERESGGKKNSRYSYLQHTWVMDVPAGGSAMLYLGGYRGNSSDGDAMLLSYSMNSDSFQSLGINLTTSDADYAVPLSAEGGTLRVRVADSDQTAGNRTLDTVYIDQLYVRTENGGSGGGGDGGDGGGGNVTPTAPAPVTNPGATAENASEVRVTWNDMSDNELGFRVERSEGGGPWETLGTAGVNSELLDDTSVSPATTYQYQVVAFNSVGDSDPSEVVVVTTPDAASISLQANGVKRKGVKIVNLTWQGLESGILYRNGSTVGPVSGGSASDDLGKGGGSYTYYLCVGALGGECSNPATVVF